MRAFAFNSSRPISGNQCTGNRHGLCYDRAGNLIFDNRLGAGGERTYDAENRVVSVVGGGLNKYVHDADADRGAAVLAGLRSCTGSTNTSAA